MTNKIGLSFLQLLIILGVFLSWELIVDFNLVSSLVLASPSSILTSYHTLPWERVINSFKQTLFEVGVALMLAVSLGVGLALFVGVRRFLRDVIDPYAVLLYSVPKVTLVPLFILWFGLGQNMIIWYAMVHGFFPIFIITMGALRDVPEIFIKHAKSVGASEPEIYLNVLLPSIFPTFLSALRLGFLLTVLGVLLGELIASTVGIGLLILISTEELRIAQLYFIVLMIGGFSVAVNQFLLSTEKRFILRRQPSV